MRLPEFITFTGVDDTTDPEALVALSKEYPVEFGVLFSPSRQGKEPRYPSEVYWRFGKLPQLRLSAHLCGAWSRGIMDGIVPPFDLSPFKRAQVNFAHPQEIHILRGLSFAKKIERPVIMQWSGPQMFPYQGGIYDEVSWLYDGSGGRGVRPLRWPQHPGKNRLVGYAGGITPDNVSTVLAEINLDGRLVHHPGECPYWIDMESGVRTDDRFDVAKCHAVCTAVYGYPR